MNHSCISRTATGIAAILALAGTSMAHADAQAANQSVVAPIGVKPRGIVEAPKAYGQIDEFTYQRTKEDLVRWETANWDGQFNIDLIVNYPRPIDKRDFRKPRLELPHEPGAILVAFKPFVKPEEAELIIAALGGKVTWQSRLVRNLFSLEVAGDLGQQINSYLDIPEVLYAEPAYRRRSTTVPNDPQYPNSDMWGMKWRGEAAGASQSQLAWDEWVGDPSFKVAVCDSGVQLDHVDLQGNIPFSNDTGNDEDGNGYTDDAYGWNVDLQRGRFNDVTSCGNSHGTHVAGTVAAVGNNSTGVVGVNWSARIIPIRGANGPSCCDGASPCGGISGWMTIRGIAYASLTGARVSNHSYGGAGESESERTTIQTAQGRNHLVVASAGNNNQNNDVIRHYPDGYELDNIISVAAIDNDGDKASFSNYGSSFVDISAPGVDIQSTNPSNGYGLKSGTSMAAPHVAGAAALIWSRHPNLTWSQVRARILTGGYPNANVPTTTGRQLDVQRALGIWVVNGGNPFTEGNRLNAVGPFNPFPPFYCRAFDLCPDHGSITILPSTSSVFAPTTITKPMTIRNFGSTPVLLQRAP